MINNGVYCIAYHDNCINNTFNSNDDCTAVNLDAEPHSPRNGIPDYYIIMILLVFLFLGIVSLILFIGIRNRKKLREYGITYDDQRHVYVNRYGVVIQEQSEEGEPEYITPKEVEPYEFYCSNCKKKFQGYEVYCPICNKRMKLYDESYKINKMKVNEKNKNKCVLCHEELKAEIYDIEECPYCESKYHKGCWIRTIKEFGKCGFCMEIPPDDMIPKDP